MANIKFYLCEQCKNLIGFIDSPGAALICCGIKMTPLVPNTSGASKEKHVPVIWADGDLITVKIGEVNHPMSEEHSIRWIFLETEKGSQKRCLLPGDEPCAEFVLTDSDRPVAVYTYCNLHGLWQTKF